MWIRDPILCIIVILKNILRDATINNIDFRFYQFSSWTCSLTPIFIIISFIHFSTTTQQARRELYKIRNFFRNYKSTWEWWGHRILVNFFLPNSGGCSFVFSRGRQWSSSIMRITKMKFLYDMAVWAERTVGHRVNGLFSHGVHILTSVTST